MLYLWLKAFHIIFVVCWFAGIFYLPRLMVNHAMVSDAATRAQLLQMEQKLYRFITPFALITVALGAWLTLLNWDAYRSQLWYWLKISLVIGLLLYHWQCGRYIQRFANNDINHGHVFFRWFNEVPVFALFGIVLLVVLKPQF